MFSPDGRWIAYVSEESGQPEVYVRSFPDSGNKWQISNQGGFSPRWSRSGAELFYRIGDKVMAVSVETSPTFRAGTPRELFSGNYDPDGFDISPDGRQFLMAKVEEESALRQVNVVLGWFEELKHVGSQGKN